MTWALDHQCHDSYAMFTANERVNDSLYNICALTRYDLPVSEQRLSSLDEIKSGSSSSHWQLLICIDTHIAEFVIPINTAPHKIYHISFCKCFKSRIFGKRGLRSTTYAALKFRRQKKVQNDRDTIIPLTITGFYACSMALHCLYNCNQCAWS